MFTEHFLLAQKKFDWPNNKALKRHGGNITNYLLDSLLITVIESCQRPNGVEKFPRRPGPRRFSSKRVLVSASRRKNSYFVGQRRVGFPNSNREMNAMKRLQIIFFVLILFAGAISAAHADCYKDGKAYPTGTVFDGFICTEDGKWVKV
jgi:hypothetical protein